MNTRRWLYALGLVVLVVLIVIGEISSHRISRYLEDHNTRTSTVAITAPVVGTSTIPTFKELEDGYYISQTFNNCGPSALSMDLSFYGVHVSQETLADDLRPTHNEQGKNDDKSTEPEEIAAEAEKYGFTAYYRPDGSVKLLEDFVANGIPVMTRTLFIPSEDYGHYRVVKGYDQTSGEIIEEDGFQGPEIHYSYASFMSLWKEFNYEYVVIVPPGKEKLVESIIGNDMQASTAWQHAAETAESQLTKNSSDTQARFNLSVAEYHLGEYQSSVSSFQAVEKSLTPHVLWYQLEPLESYYELGEYNEVISHAQAILTGGDPVYPDLLVLEGEAYLKEGNSAEAKQLYEEALTYNKNLASAKSALASL